MATIKSFTSLQQSKKLVEILPLETADIYYPAEGASPKFGVALSISTNIPCWSLAALLDVLPDELEDNHFLTLDKEGKEYCCCYEDGNGNSFKHKFADNPIDACVAMIEHLHELKIL